MSRARQLSKLIGASNNAVVTTPATFSNTVAVAASGITYGDSTVQLTAPSGFAFKNRIINGAMVIDQRNAGAAITPSNTGASYGYPVDRFFVYNNTTVNFTAQRSTVAPAGFTNSTLLSFASTITPSAGVEANFSQWIEGFNIADFGFGTANAQPVTLSFWVRSSITGTFGLGFGKAKPQSVLREYKSRRWKY